MRLRASCSDTKKSDKKDRWKTALIALIMWTTSL